MTKVLPYVYSHREYYEPLTNELGLNTSSNNRKEDKSPCLRDLLAQTTIRIVYISDRPGEKREYEVFTSVLMSIISL